MSAPQLARCLSTRTTFVQRLLAVLRQLDVVRAAGKSGGRRGRAERTFSVRAYAAPQKEITMQDHKPDTRPDWMKKSQRDNYVRQALRVRGYCHWHRLNYAANVWVRGNIQATDCPDCIKEREYGKQAFAALVAEMGKEAANVLVHADPGALLERAEALAGWRFMRYGGGRRPAPADDAHTTEPQA